MPERPVEAGDAALAPTVPPRRGRSRRWIILVLAAAAAGAVLNAEVHYGGAARYLLEAEAGREYDFGFPLVDGRYDVSQESVPPCVASLDLSCPPQGEQHIIPPAFLLNAGLFAAAFIALGLLGMRVVLGAVVAGIAGPPVVFLLASRLPSSSPPGVSPQGAVHNDSIVVWCCAVVAMVLVVAAIMSRRMWLSRGPGRSPRTRGRTA